VAFIDDDAIPEPHWLASLAREFEDPAVMAVGGRIVGLRGGNTRGAIL
jgi:cellulose synthase/poly-beta-1,6-N-acetylglucosamine synthase-like glycosyltransferase